MTAAFMELLVNARYARPVIPNLGNYRKALDSIFGDILNMKRPAGQLLGDVGKTIQKELDDLLKEQ